jgi:hypothetical protein
MSEPESKFTECYVAFLDLMGMNNLVKKCGDAPELYRKVITALQETKDIGSLSSERRDLETKDVKHWVLQVQAFSDCVVLFIPTDSRMLSWMLASIRRLHDRLLELHVPLRGGIVVGGMHWDDSWSRENPVTLSSAQVAFGPGLVAAYDLESSVAVYPRILISDDLVGILKDEDVRAKAFPLGIGSLCDYCRQDFDGLYHFDVLHRDIDRKDVESIQHEVIDGKTWKIHSRCDIPIDRLYAMVRQFICDGLETLDGAKLQAKYRWLARYYNSTVDKTKIGNPISIFEDRVPEGAIPLEINCKSFGVKRTTK